MDRACNINIALCTQVSLADTQELDSVLANILQVTGFGDLKMDMEISLSSHPWMLLSILSEPHQLPLGI
jgi:hypothetical protein